MMLYRFCIHTVAFILFLTGTASLLGSDLKEEKEKDRIRTLVKEKFCEGELDLNKETIGDNGLNILCDEISNLEVKKLSLYNTYITEKSMEKFGQTLSKNKNIKIVNLGENNLTDNGLKTLSLYLKNSGIEEISFYDTGLSDKSIDSLKEIIWNNTCLTKLWILNNTITKNGFRDLDNACQKYDRDLTIR